MSVSYKKINSMIHTAVYQMNNLADDKKDILKELCEKIYMIETTTGHISSQQTISDIKGEITLKSDKF